MLAFALLLLPAPPAPFQAHTTTDRFGRTITYYLADAPAPAPLAVFVQGTGCESVFPRRDGRLRQGAQILLHEAARGRARVLVVEKPGVHLGDEQPDAGNARTCAAEFLAEHTLERWSEAIAASIRAAQQLPGVDRSRTLIIGGSEGGVVAVRVSNILPAVTHAASLAGGGPNHLFILADYVRRRKLDPEEEVYRCWAAIRQDPGSTTRFCWGQPHRLWSSLLATSLAAECLRSRAALYLAHGTADEQSPIAAFDMLRAELAAKGREAVFDRVEGGGHSLARAGEDPGDALLAAFRRICDWFALP